MSDKNKLKEFIGFCETELKHTKVRIRFIEEEPLFEIIHCKHNNPKTSVTSMMPINYGENYQVCMNIKLEFCTHVMKHILSYLPFQPCENSVFQAMRFIFDQLKRKKLIAFDEYEENRRKNHRKVNEGNRNKIK